MELGTGPPRYQPLIAIKDAKGIKDRRAAAGAIFANLVRSMCAEPMHCENSAKTRQPREQGDPSSLDSGARGLHVIPAIFRANLGSICLTYVLFAVENVINVIEPFVLGLAIDGMLKGSYEPLGWFATQHLAHLVIGVARRAYDTRMFSRIHADLVTCALRQRSLEFRRDGAVRAGTCGGLLGSLLRSCGGDARRNPGCPEVRMDVRQWSGWTAIPDPSDQPPLRRRSTLFGVVERRGGGAGLTW
jgi:hypothetical protein